MCTINNDEYSQYQRTDSQSEIDKGLQLEKLKEIVESPGNKSGIIFKNTLVFIIQLNRLQVNSQNAKKKT